MASTNSAVTQRVWGSGHSPSSRPLSGGLTNYYRRYPGDYARDTKHLTLAEHGAYTLLLDYLYGTQRVLPGLALGLYRICGAQTTEEQWAVDSVVDQFFVKGVDGYSHPRVDEEIRQAESRIKAAVDNGKKGGRPRQQETQKKPSGLADRNPEHNPQESYPSSNHHIKSIEREWPDNFTLLPEMRDYALARGVPSPQEEFSAWENDCKAHGRKYRNWMAAWRTRVDRYHQFNKGAKNGKSGKLTGEELTEHNLRVAGFRT